MPRRRFTEEQIRQALADLEAGMKVPAVCNRYHVSERTLYLWRARARRKRPPEPSRVPPPESSHE